MKKASLLLITLLSFILSTYLLGQLVPSPAIPQNLPIISAKYAHYQTHKNDYNTLFFGSSRIYHHIDPATFDRTAQQAGLSTHSFNFGVSGLKPLHNYALLQEILKDPPAQLKWVFIEDAIDQGSAPLGEVRTNRAIYWHTWKNTLYSLHFVLNHPDTTLRQKATYSFGHLIPFFYRTINLGRALSQWVPTLHLSEEESAIATQFIRRLGYRPIDFEMPKQQYFLANLDSYQQEVKQLAQKKQQITYQTPLSPIQITHLQNIAKTVKAANAVPLFVVAPTTIYQETIHRAYHQQKIEHLLSFNDPNQYPQLFNIHSRTDWDHLTPSSAEAFTQLLAKEFSHIAQQPQTAAVDIANSHNKSIFN